MILASNLLPHGVFLLNLLKPHQPEWWWGKPVCSAWEPLDPLKSWVVITNTAGDSGGPLM